jgi:peptide/nickel transport system substrate-binding protein
MAEQHDSERTAIDWLVIQDIYIDEGPFGIGIAGDRPAPVIAKNYVHNVLNSGVIEPWAPAVPGNQDPSEWWMEAQ